MDVNAFVNDTLDQSRRTAAKRLLQRDMDAWWRDMVARRPLYEQVVQDALQSDEWQGDRGEQLGKLWTMLKQYQDATTDDERQLVDEWLRHHHRTIPQGGWGVLTMPHIDVLSLDQQKWMADTIGDLTEGDFDEDGILIIDG